MKIKELLKSYALPLLFNFSLLFFIFREIIFKSGTHLLDTNDYPYYAVILNHFISFLLGTSTSFFETGFFYPNPGTYFFSDLLIPQSLIGVIPSLLGFNILAVTNFIVVTTMVLNILAAAFFWRKWFPKPLTLTFLTLATSLSPFIILQRGHLQMITIWPFLLVLNLLLSAKRKKIDGVVLGLIWTVQLLASVYLAFFSLTCIAWFAILEIIVKKEKRKTIMFYLFVSLAIAVTSVPILIKYKLVQKQNQVQISYHEYVSYSAHASDYLFLPYETLGSNLTTKWQQLNQHKQGETAVFPGIAISILAFLGLFSFKKSKTKLQISFNLNIENLFFGGLLLVGFLFSLGPRLSVNGAYAQLLLPYAVVLKVLPFFEAIRATARWSWLVHIALIYFAGVSLKKLETKKYFTPFALSCIFIYCIQFIPTQSSAVDVSAVFSQDYPLLAVCEENNSVAILPFSEKNSDSTLYTNLARKTSHLLKTTQHGCKLINGYGGFEPKSFQSLDIELNSLFANENYDDAWHVLENYQADLVLIETTKLDQNTKESLETYFSLDENQEKINILNQEQGAWYLIELQHD